MIFLLTSLSFIFTFFIFYQIGPKFKLIDEPNFRKIHHEKVPLVGGLIIYFNVFFYFYFISDNYYLNVIFYTSFILLVLGSIDDAVGLGVIFRLISQLISSLIVIGSGIIITNIGAYINFPNINLGIFSIIFTSFCIIVLTNSFNFIDGIDGLCAGIFLTSLISLLIFIYYLNNNFLVNDMKIIFILIISVTIFLFFNMTTFFKVFLGDSGSMFLGFLIACLLIYSTQVEQLMHPVLAIWCVSIPSFDILSVIIRRLLRKKNPFRPDKRHIHHIILNLGYKKNFISFFLITISLLLNLFGFIIYFIFGSFTALILFVIVFLIYLLISIYASRKSIN